MLKEIENTFAIQKNEEEKEEKQLDGHINTSTSVAIKETVAESIQDLANRYTKPEKYNRKLYDDGAAKRKLKAEAFKNKDTVIDSNTGKELKLTKKEAKLEYGHDWENHVMEADHVVPLKKIHSEYKDNPWTKISDIKDVANSGNNMKGISRKTNNAKRDRTNEELIRDKKYREEKGVFFTEEGERIALEEGEKAGKFIQKSLYSRAVNNIVKEGHNAGLKGAKEAGETACAMSVIMNIIAVIKGEKEPEEAVIDTAKVTGRSTVTGYATGSGLSVLSHSLSGSKSEFIKKLGKSNVPAKVISAVMATWDTAGRYLKGEITTQECIIELGDTGLSLATIGYYTLVGQSLIPIPVIGGAVGALIGGYLTSGLYYNLVNTLRQKELEHQERVRIIEECNEVAEQTRIYRLELESYLDEYFHDYKSCFDEALSLMEISFQGSDADGIIAGANRITEKLGGVVHYETVEEFKNWFDNTTVDII